MKKLFTLGLVFVLATGCSSSKLTCTKDNKSEGTKETMIINFKKKEASSMEMIQEYKDKKTAEETCSLMKSFYTKDTDFEFECKGKKLIMKVSDISKISESNDYKNKSKEDLKKEAEKDGYSCK